MTHGSTIENQILAILIGHRGPAQAITAEAIGHAVYGRAGCARQVRDAIARLIEERGYGEIIANTGGGEAFRGAPAGYFWATHPAQVEAYYNVLLSRREEIGRRMVAAYEAKRRLANLGEAQPALVME